MPGTSSATCEVISFGDFELSVGPSRVKDEAFFIPDAWVLRRICNEGHLCPFKFFSNGGLIWITLMMC